MGQVVGLVRPNIRCAQLSPFTSRELAERPVLRTKAPSRIRETIFLTLARFSPIRRVRALKNEVKKALTQLIQYRLFMPRAIFGTNLP